MFDAIQYRRLLFTCILMMNTVAVYTQSISSFTPVSGATGAEGTTTITISGSGFSTTASNNVVFFGAARTTASAATATSLTVTAPAGATYEHLKVVNLETNKSVAAYSKAPFIPTFYNEGAMQLSSSAGYTLSYTSSKPYFKIGDIDGDGKVDIVLMNVAANSLSILLNTSSVGALSFAAKVDITTGTSPQCFVIDDVDGDGKVDLVVGNAGDKTFSVHINNSTPGSVSFAAGVAFATSVPDAPNEITTVDYDLDGKPEVVYNYTNGTGSLLHMFKNNSTPGTPSFNNALNDAGNSPRNIVCTDFDQDGKVDVGVVSNATGSFFAYRNTTAVPGTLSISVSSAFMVGSNPVWIAAGDIDGDGKPDIVSTNSGGSNVAYSLNNGSVGTISLAARSGNSISTTPSCVLLADVDGDGRPDMVASGRGNSTINFFRNFSSPGAVVLGGRVSIATITSPDFFAFCDFDGDGKPDLAVVNSSTLSVTKSLSKQKMFVGRMPF